MPPAKDTVTWSEIGRFGGFTLCVIAFVFYLARLESKVDASVKAGEATAKSIALLQVAFDEQFPRRPKSGGSAVVGVSTP